MKVSVWYANNEFMREAGFNDDLPVDLGATHSVMPLCGFVAEDGSPHTVVLEKAFSHFNWVAEDFVAPPAIRKRLESLKYGCEVAGVTDIMKHVWHSSMSVGDVVELDGVAYLCSMVGWKKLKK